MFLHKWHRLIFFTLGVAALAATLGACGGISSAGKTYCIATDLPVSGADASVGMPTENGAHLAVMQNQDLGGGNKLEFRAFDDVTTQAMLPDPNQGAANVKAMIATRCIVAMVGTFTSEVSAAEMPITAKANLAMISPSNTSPGLTLQQYAAAYGFTWSNLHPVGYPINYFRIAANDIVQGQIDAAFTYTAPTASPPGLGTHNVYLVDDSTPYDAGLADYYTMAYERDGGTILGRSRMSATEFPPLPQLAGTILATHPDAIFYSGVSASGAGLLDAQLVAQGYTGPFVGGDGIATDARMITEAGPAAVNLLGSTDAPDPSLLTGSAATAFKDAYKAAFHEDVGAYSARAYDAAMIEITMIKHLIKAGKDVTRLAVAQGIAALSASNPYVGVTGKIYFDTNGDNAGNRVFSIYGVKNGAWAFLEAVPVQ